jgi:hypothetical protein
MRPEELEGILAFLGAAERLKTATRSGWTSAGQPESVAEHSWRLCLMAMLLYGRAPDVDLTRLLKMCLIHDLGEALSGDVPAPAQSADLNKAERERSDLIELIRPLPPHLQDFNDPYVHAGKEHTWTRPWNFVPGGDYTWFVAAAPGSYIAEDPLTAVVRGTGARTHHRKAQSPLEAMTWLACV